MANQINYEEVKLFIENNNCILLTKKEDYMTCKEKIEIKCNCGEVFLTNFDKFKNRNKRQCNTCGIKINSQKKIIPFGIIKNFIDKNSDCILLTAKEEYIRATSKIKLLCGCKKNTFIVKFYKFKNQNKRQCNDCGKKIGDKKRRYSYEQIINYINLNSSCKLFTLEKDMPNSTYKKIKFICSCGEIFETTFHSFKCSNKRQCDKCRRKKMSDFKSKTHEEFCKNVYDLVGDEYDVLGTYESAKNKILIKHNICNNKYYVTPDSFISSGHRCPICNESKGEHAIRIYLENNKILFKNEYTFDDLIGLGNGFLRFDFAIFNNYNKLEYLVEYDGKQHYEWIKGFMTYEEFLKLQYHDKLKNQYCLKNNFPLLRIPCWEFNNIEIILKEYIDNSKIKEAI